MPYRVSKRIQGFQGAGSVVFKRRPGLWLETWPRSTALGLVRTVAGFTLLCALSRSVPAGCQAGNVLSSFNRGRKCGLGNPGLWPRPLSLAQSAGTQPDPSTAQPAGSLELTGALLPPLGTLYSAGVGRSRPCQRMSEKASQAKWFSR